MTVFSKLWIIHRIIWVGSCKKYLFLAPNIYFSKSGIQEYALKKKSPGSLDLKPRLGLPHRQEFHSISTKEANLLHRARGKVLGFVGRDGFCCNNSSAIDGT